MKNYFEIPPGMQFGVVVLYDNDGQILTVPLGKGLTPSKGMALLLLAFVLILKHLEEQQPKLILEIRKGIRNSPLETVCQGVVEAYFSPEKK
jgi:hypothetical protein